MDFNGNQMVQGSKDSFSANCKLLKGLLTISDDE